MLQQSRLDLPVLGFTVLISLATGLLFGIAPALAVSRTKVYETLKEGGRNSTESRARHRLRGLLVVSEVALALLLMIGASLMIRTSSDPLRFAPALRQAVLELDREQPVSRVAAMEQTLADSLAAKRFSTVLLGIFAVVALVLAAIGIYGVISFSVTRRTHEIGIRMALGARSADVLRMVVLEGTLLALMGVSIGLAAAFALASYLPARRAACVDPMVALRYE
jgi:ABC-type antimicrobial peptide transport system permease subunit